MPRKKKINKPPQPKTRAEVRKNTKYNFYKNHKKRPEYKDKYILFIDCANLVHRMYHTFKHLRNSAGLSTGAFYGFFNMLLHYTEKFDTNKVILFWEGKGNFRYDIFPDYKISRRQRTDETTIERKDFDFIYREIFLTCIRSGFVNIAKDNYESDDMIAYFCTLFEKNIKIITNDKDMLQLVNNENKIRVVRPDPKYGHKLYNEKLVELEWKVPINRLTDVMALQGDSVDDIPGLKGVGEKTAIKMVLETKNRKELLNKMNEDQKKIFLRNLRLIGFERYKKPGTIPITKESVLGVSVCDREKVAESLSNMAIAKYDVDDIAYMNNPQFNKRVLEVLLKDLELYLESN